MTKEELANLLIEITTAGQELQSAGMCGKDMREHTAKCKELRKAVLTEFERLTKERDEACFMNVSDDLEICSLEGQLEDMQRERDEARAQLAQANAEIERLKADNAKWFSAAMFGMEDA